MEEKLITSEWLISKGFKMDKIGSYQKWRRVNDEGLFLDYLMFYKNEMASYGLIGLDKGTYFQSIMQNEKKCFYTFEIVEIWKLLAGVDLGD
jgi:hypothetical protein